MNTTITCTNSTIDPYIPSDENPWNIQNACHLFRRAAFGADPEKINAALLKSPEEVVDDLFEESLNLELDPGPDWRITGETPFNPNALRLFIKKFIADHLLSNYLKYRLTFFWMNHFVIEGEVVVSAVSNANYYYGVILPNCMGNFKTFVHAIGTDSAMLAYLKRKYKC